MTQPDQRTIVSVTPIAVQRDSRTFKEAASFARSGYRSIVVEGEPSSLDRSSLPFELVSIGRPRTAGSNGHQQASPASAASPGLGTSARALGRQLPAPVRVPLAAGAYLARYTSVYVLRTLAALPPADLYWLHAFYQYPAVRLAARRSGAPIVYDAHDFYTEMALSRDLTLHERYFVNPLHREIETQCINDAAEVVTVSDGVAELIASRFRRRPIVVRNADDTRIHRTERPSLREHLALGSEAFIIVAVGQAKPGRAISEAIASLQALPEYVHLAFLGRGYEPYLQRDVPKALAGRVHQILPVQPFEVAPFIASADVSLILYYARTRNYRNALPNGFFQSVAAGLPLLYPELPEISRLAKQYGLGLPVDPLQPASVATAVARLLARPTLFRELRRAVEAARAELSWEAEEARLLEIVERVLERRAGRL